MTKFQSKGRGCCHMKHLEFLTPVPPKKLLEQLKLE